MDIIILALNSKYIHSSLAPWYLKAEIADLKIDAKVIEHTVNEPVESVASDIIGLAPKMLAVSVYIWNIEYTYSLIKRVKSALPNTIIVLGGPEVSYNAEEVFEKSACVDYIISGEGEIPFGNLARHILLGECLEDAGICTEWKISAPYVGNNTPKSPYCDEYFSNLKNRIAYFESSRGCPYSCAYCLSGRCEGLRFFDISEVKDNLIKLSCSGIKTVKFVDRTFNADKNRALEIWRFILDNRGTKIPCDVCFHFELSGDLLDDEAIGLLSDAPEGVFQFEIGIQSFNEDTISAIHRKTNSEVLKNKIKRLAELGNAHLHTDLIAGLPFENLESFKQSFNQAYELSADMLQLGFLKVLHGTEIERRAEEYELEFSIEPPYEVYQTPWLSCEEIEQLKIAEKALDRLHNSGKFKRTLEFCMRFFSSPFDFFYEVGLETKDTVGLDNLTDALYTFMCKCTECRASELRDIMVLDRLATNSSKRLPSSLYRFDERLSALKKQINMTVKNIGNRRSVAILYSLGKGVYVDYIDKNFKGEYRLNFISLEENLNYEI